MKFKKEVINWAKDKNITNKENSLPQFIKILEEVNEVGKALVENNREELIDGIGDSVVTLIILAEQNNLDIEECLESAYNVIKNRTGKTINGTFVKD